MMHLIVIILLTLLAVTAVLIVRMRGLFPAVMLGGIYSFIGAGWMLLLDAPDVAFTEAAVGAGISTVLMLGALSLTTPHESRRGSQRQWLAILVVVATGAALILATLDMPAYGDPQAPAHTHVAPEYLHESKKATGIDNIVTTVLASYRGFDTLGEVFVIFTAGVGVLVLLRRSRRDEEDAS